MRDSGFNWIYCTMVFPAGVDVKYPLMADDQQLEPTTVMWANAPSVKTQHECAVGRQFQVTSDLTVKIGKLRLFAESIPSKLLSDVASLINVQLGADLKTMLESGGNIHEKHVWIRHILKRQRTWKCYRHNYCSEQSFWNSDKQFIRRFLNASCIPVRRLYGSKGDKSINQSTVNQEWSADRSLRCAWLVPTLVQVHVMSLLKHELK